ncbi:MAG: sulfur carrier protein ThiS [Bacteroidales bacterium]|nr:sulfur carrier protein ThiS [Bacteroidales bacterium]
MKVFVNKKDTIVPMDCSITELLSAVGKQDTFGIAVAIGTKVIQRDKWQETKLQEGDAVTIIEATCGG